MPALICMYSFLKYIFILLEVSLWGGLLAVGLLGRKGSAYAVLLCIAKFLSRRVLPICIPTRSVGECWFSHSLLDGLCCHIVKFLPVWQVRKVSRESFNLNFSNYEWVWTFLFICRSLFYLFCELSVHVFSLVFLLSFILLPHKFWEVFIYKDISPLLTLYVVFSLLVSWLCITDNTIHTFLKLVFIQICLFLFLLHVGLDHR